MAVGNLGTLSVILAAGMAKFNKDMDDAKGRIGGVAATMRGLIGTAAKLTAAATIAGVAITASLVKAGMASVVQQQQLARSVNGTINGLRALTEAGESLGLEAEEIAAALGVVNARLGEAERKGSPAAKMLENLGLRARDLAKLDVDERLAVIADRVKELGLSSSQTADLARQLGIRSRELAALLLEGGDAIRSAREDVDKLGLSISEVDAAQVEAAQRAMNDIADTLENIRDQIAIALAPYIAEVANLFNDAAAASGGFREQALSAVDATLRGFAKVADVLRGVQVVFGGLKLLAAGFGAAVVSAVQIAAEGIVAWGDVAINVINGIIVGLNQVPGVDIAKIDPLTNSAFMQGLRRFADESRNLVGDVRHELHELAMQPLPSENVEAFLARVKARAAEAAQEVVATRSALAGLGGAEGFGEEEDTAAADKAEEARKRAAELLLAEEQARLERVASLREFMLTEEQLEAEAHANRLVALAEMSESELALIGGYDATKEQLERDHQARLQAIREAAMTDLEKFQAMSQFRQVQTVIGSIADMTAGVASGNKKLFELHRAAALAQAVVSLPAAIIDSYKNAGGWPLGAAAAATMAAAGAAQIQQIKNAKFGGGGGGSAPSAAGAGGGAAAAPSQAISISGLSPDSLFSGRQIRTLLERLQEGINDGGKLVLD